jgi:hypothetical protein
MIMMGDAGSNCAQHPDENGLSSGLGSMQTTLVEIWNNKIVNAPTTDGQ